jgi:membrane protease YdiL (CAAX protease family)
VPDLNLLTRSQAIHKATHADAPQGIAGDFVSLYKMPMNSKTPCAALLEGWRNDLALRKGRNGLGDFHFILALLAGMLFWLLWPWLAGSGEEAPAYNWPALAMLILLQPLMEELLFRGLIQGKLLAYAWGRRRLVGLTQANLTSSVLFTTLHFTSHPPLWAMGVLLPSLLFGYFRDRHDSIYPAIVLHIFYNAGYFLILLRF